MYTYLVGTIYKIFLLWSFTLCLGLENKHSLVSDFSIMYVIFLPECSTHIVWVTGKGKGSTLLSITSMVGDKGKCFLNLMTPP
jgi:hypothetical protein